MTYLLGNNFFYGIRGTANASLTNYLTDINQYVIADDHSSGMRLITVGYHKDQYLADLGRFRIRSRNQRTNLNPNPDLIPDSDSCVVESDLESESCRFESESDSDS